MCESRANQLLDVAEHPAINCPGAGNTLLTPIGGPVKVITVRTVSTNADDHVIVVDGKQVPTLCDAAKQLGVSAKTIREWIKKGIIDRPPRVAHGARFVDTFPREYLRKAKTDVERYRENKDGPHN